MAGIFSHQIPGDLKKRVWLNSQPQGRCANLLLHDLLWVTRDRPVAVASEELLLGRHVDRNAE